LLDRQAIMDRDNPAKLDGQPTCHGGGRTAGQEKARMTQSGARAGQRDRARISALKSQEKIPRSA
jgi:hypothetical protein